MKLGTYFYFITSESFLVHKLLTVQNENYLVTSYWPVEFEPKVERLSELEVSSFCTEIPNLDNAISFHISEISEQENQEIKNYLRIKEGLTNRTNQYQFELEKANTHYEQKEWAEAITAYSNVALYSKYSIDIYEKRGICFYNIEKFSDALYDFDFVLSSKPTDELVLQLSERCKIELQKKRK